MIAEFDSRCPICDAAIIADQDEIEKNVDDEWCHKACVEDEV